MVINDRYRFVFAHVPKTAGTSIAAALGSLDGTSHRWVSSAMKHETLLDLSARVSQRSDQPDSDSAVPIESYLAFGFVRNPWDRMVSIYRYLQEARPRPEIQAITSFECFVRRAAEGEPWIRGLHSIRPQIAFLAIPTRSTQAAFVGHTEHLLEDLAVVSKRLGLSLSVPHLNASSNRTSDYRAEYTDTLAEVVGDLFAPDVKAFGYTFDARPPARRCSGPLPDVIAERLQ
ncbi:MAG: sulfotransferase family 2 domain-containing protein [Acidobacteria bacterium]|nr:sulfotransferase family 2 domain-containing protein [Acidobacteriota bacterium]